MSAWNTVYKQYPTNSNNPGYGADAIRDLKTNLEGVFASGHNFDTTDISNQGKHLAGTAIIDLDSDEDAINNLQVGRLKGTTTDVEDETTVTLQVKGEDADQDIKGYDQVSKSDEQIITGEKTFTVAPIITATVDEDSDDDTIANVGYVNTKTLTTSIEPSVVNVGPTLNVEIESYNDDTIAVITQKVDSTNLEELLAQMKLEISELRAALTSVGAMSPYGQNLKSDGTPTFSTVSASKVYGAVWG